MSTGYWQAKIWGILHDPIFKPLYISGKGGNSFWRELAAMQDWVSNKCNPEESGKIILKHIKLADYITSASDRAAIGSLTDSISYKDQGLEIVHLLSAAKQTIKIPQHQKLLERNRQNYLDEKEKELLDALPQELRSATIEETAKIKKLFWWLWRCLPEAACQKLDTDLFHLMPGETRLPDASIFSHTSLTSAMAGALAGFDLKTEDIINNWSSKKKLSHPYLVSFTFSPIQELIKASRKMRDLWAGSWLLHYLSAHVCWKLACQYGPDTLIYPSLYQQPLIDHWLLEKYPDFKSWVTKPEEQSLLTAGFPNIIILVLPKDKVSAAMQTAKSELINEWMRISQLVFTELESRDWMPQLTSESHTWKSWLKSQWQIYWAAVPIGKEGESLTSSEIYKDNDSTIPENENEVAAQTWRDKQNIAYGLSEKNALFQKQEQEFLQEAAKLRRERFRKHPFSSNIGSWWNHIFDQLRTSLTALKNARTWEVPTAFGPRSTISGLGSVVHPDTDINDWITEGKTQKYWQNHAGLFNGVEQLNATETVKRGLHIIIPELLNLNSNDNNLDYYYPDLTAGVAGYLKVHSDINPEVKSIFNQACQEIVEECRPWISNAIEGVSNKWGIPWADKKPSKYHPRLLNPSWLVENIKDDIREVKSTYIEQINKIIQKYYPSNNPTSWYILACGDGDSMGEWLKGTKLKTYKSYIPTSLNPDPQIEESFKSFIELPKRMGPSTHSALSRALLDFSNQLVPHITESRYAGRLIYSGGDDVLAYTNLWEWDKWLWDIRQCFRGKDDPQHEFTSEGDYWQSDRFKTKRPLFTMGRLATISFGLVIAHHSVPLAIALENLWEAEEEAKKYVSLSNEKKDAVQVRVIYGNGNILKATTKFCIFHKWQLLLDLDIESSIFEQAANLLEQHPIPCQEAITPWTNAFCSRREQLKEKKILEQIQNVLGSFFDKLWLTTQEDRFITTAKDWLKLAAFVKRNREIKLNMEKI